MTNHDIISTLGKQSLATAMPLPSEIDLQSMAWKDFRSTWNSLCRDAYMADGGTYRYRRYTTFAAEGANLQAKPYAPHFQLVDHNYLHGGVERFFEPMLPAATENPLFRRIIRRCLDVFEAREMAGGRLSKWHIEVHQLRIYAFRNHSGYPTPEGIHRDGRDFVFIMLLHRQNITGGDTTVFDRNQRELFHGTLKNAGDSLFFDDHEVLHSVSPIQPTDITQGGYRDILVATFCNTERPERSFGQSTQKDAA